MALWALVLFALGSNGSGAAPTLSGKSLSMSSMSGGASAPSNVQSVPAKSMPVRSLMKTASLRTTSAKASPLVVSPSVVAPVPNVTAPGPLTGYSVVEDRPDFSYRQAALKFIEQPTFTTGQIGMGIGPGLPVGTVRYVPVGEF
ncbi:MAG: hypothetical protein AMXMBFR33_51360 [Candidatus Xenobia bacterium]